MKKLLSTIAMAAVCMTPMHAANSGTEDVDAMFQELTCLAKNIYFETRADTLIDAISVSDVVMNRVEDPRYPNTICEVVHQGVHKSNGAPVRNKCHFSWYCDGKSDIPRDKIAWEKSQGLAWNFIMNPTWRGITEGATHYHASYVKPYWIREMTKITRMGHHIFYRWEKE